MVNGDFGQGYTIGVQQGEDARFIKVAVTLKHWDAYSLEDSDGFQRYNFNAVVSNYTLADSFFPAFQASVVKGNAQGVMCSYNAVNGVPTCASGFLSSVLRGQWGFTGYITSDSGALENIAGNHHYTNNSEQSACVAITAGTCDVCSGGIYANNLLPAVQAGLCTMADVDRALTNTFRLRFHLGLFDPIDDQPYWHGTASDIGTPFAQARASLVSSFAEARHIVISFCRLPIC
jgi:beta-glucosidase-like glycosyl hydrolase